MRRALSLFLCAFATILAYAEAPIVAPNRTFFAEKIALRGDEMVYLQPRLAYFPTTEKDTYQLQLTVPDFLEYDAEISESLRPLTDGGGFTVLSRTFKVEKGNNGTNVITVVPELNQLYGYEIGRTVPRPFTVSFEVRGNNVAAGSKVTSENVPTAAERGAYSLYTSGTVVNGRLQREQDVLTLPQGTYDWQTVTATW